MNTSQHHVFIPRRFEETVALHILKHTINTPVVRAPLILGIHGPSGEGKTFQCEFIFGKMGVRAILISGKELESERAGEPGKLLSRRYLEACGLLERREAPMTVLFINDLDAGIGRWGANVQYTVNTQIVNATIMNLADYPPHTTSSRVCRPPIIVTGNDFTTLYQPLVRLGRMTLFDWTPTIEEKIEAVRSIFSDISLTENDLTSLVTTFQRQPIAFFAQLRSALHDDYFLETIRRVGISKVLHQARDLVAVQEALSRPHADLQLLTKIGHSIVNSSKVLSHISDRTEAS